MSNNVQKYENWRAITESDYVTMFIKTWFAFVATLRELYPKESVEDVIGKGDKVFLNPYLDGFQNVHYYYNKFNSVKDNILKVYKLGRCFTLKNAKYNRFFSEDFYAVNKSFSWKQTTDDYECSIKYAGDTFISIHAKFLDKDLYIDGIPLIISEKIDVSDLLSSDKLTADQISKYLDDEAAFIEFVTKKITDRVSLGFIQQITNGDYKSKLVPKALARLNATTLSINAELEKTLALMKESNIKKEDVLFSQLPCAHFIYKVEDDDTVPEIDTYKWFLNFVYFMRNALFHEIIDPLDSFWQEIFKHSYMALKELLDGNINYFIDKEQVLSKLQECAKNEILEKPNVYIPNFNENYNNGDLKIELVNYVVDNIFITVKAIITMEYWYDDHTMKRMVSKVNFKMERFEKRIEKFKMEFMQHEDN